MYLNCPFFPVHTLWSTENHQLTPPRCRVENFGKRAFAAAAPLPWNNLPLDIKQSPSVNIFMYRTRIHLIQLAYFLLLCKSMPVYYHHLHHHRHHHHHQQQQQQRHHHHHHHQQQQPQHHNHHYIVIVIIMTTTTTTQFNFHPDNSFEFLFELVNRV